MNNKKLATIYIIRHGEAEHNVIIKSNKPFDPDLEISANLTELGVLQANKLSKKFKNINFDAIYSSDMARAKQTAEILALEKKIAVQTTDTIRERSAGKNAGRWHLLKEELKKELEKLSDEAKMQYRFDDEETDEEATTRLITFIREIGVAYREKKVLVVCHGGLMRKFLVKIGFAKFDELPGDSVSNTGYIVIDTDGTDIYIKETYGVKKFKN